MTHAGTRDTTTQLSISSSSSSLQGDPGCLTGPNQASRAALESISSHQAGAALWRLYETAKPAAAVISSVQAAVQASAAAGSAALGYAAGGGTEEEEAIKDAAAAAIHAKVAALSEELLRTAGRVNFDHGDRGIPRGQPAHMAAAAVAAHTGSLLPDFAAQALRAHAVEKGIKVGRAECAEAAASRAAARVISSPWLGLSRSGLAKVVGSLQLDLVKVSREHRQLLGGWMEMKSAGGYHCF